MTNGEVMTRLCWIYHSDGATNVLRFHCCELMQNIAMARESERALSEEQRRPMLQYLASIDGLDHWHHLVAFRDELTGATTAQGEQHEHR